MRSEWVFAEELRHILATLTPENRLACEVSLATGLRIDDVLHIRTEQLRSNKVTVREMKTGKTRRVYIPQNLLECMRMIAGRKWVFQGRTSWNKTRTRQAVWKDLKRSADLFRVKVNLTPHSCRKVYAVAEYHRSGSIKRVQELLNHSSEAVTYIYAMADELTRRRYGGKVKGKTAERG